MRKLILITLIIFYPLTVHAAPITSPFGWRVHPITGKYSFHTGIDIGYEFGDSIVAMLPGKVVYADWYGGYGNCVILEHANGDHTLYAHCSNIYCSYGQNIEQGTIIAAVGNTGNSTGPHLHLEYWHNGQYADPITLWG